MLSEHDEPAAAAVPPAVLNPLSPLAVPLLLKPRIRGDSKQKDHVARFLTNALGVGDQASQDTHDRVVFVRSASFRNLGWDWLQDKHVQPDRLILPGVSLSDDTEPPSPLLPCDCPAEPACSYTGIPRSRVGTGEKPSWELEGCWVSSFQTSTKRQFTRPVPAEIP
jgi:hypothetical protein